MIQDIKICNIYAPNKEDYDFLVGHLSKHPVNIFYDVPDEFDQSTPSIIVGCLFVKEKFVDYNIFDAEILPNLTWAYSSKEKNKEFHNQINNFVVKSLKTWLPSDLILYDPFLNGDFEVFLNKNIEKRFKTYVYFHQGAIYLNNNKKNFVINLKNLFYLDKNIKDKLSLFLSDNNFLFYSYSNIASIFSIEIPNIKTLDNICWIKFGVEIDEESFFNIIPGYDIKKFIPFLMSCIPDLSLNAEEEKCLRRLQEKDAIVRWISKGYLCFDPSFENDNLQFLNHGDKKFSQLNYSHKRTITGRIVCKDVYNVQNLQRDGDDKKKIISRFKGGKILVCDYVSFESKIALYISEDTDFIDKFWDKDLHLETASIIYGPLNIQPDQRKIGKDVNHAIMFGGGDDLILSKLSLLPNAKELLYEIRLFLSPILNKAYRLNEFQKENGYIIDDWGYIINPKKDFAAFNNYIQATAAEILTDKLFEIKHFLNNKESKFLFPVHDSMVFDISPNEKELIKELPKLLSTHKNKTFGISYKIGDNYKELGEEKILI